MEKQSANGKLSQLDVALEVSVGLSSMVKSAAWAFVVLIAACCVSCSDDGRRPVFPVFGKVTYQGKPTDNALIIFHPVSDPDPNAPHPLTRVGADGSFKLTTYETDDGAPAGEYDVTITWVNEVDNQNAPKEDQRPAKNMIPDRYAKAETSGLRVTVKKESNNLPPFELTAK